MCWSCIFSKDNFNPKNIMEVDNHCMIPSILKLLELDENRVYCPHYSIDEKVRDCGSEHVLSEVAKNVKDEYLDGKCPDCFEQIPDDVVKGDKCPNCGHVFHRLEAENVKRIGEMREEGYMQREQGWKKGMGL